MGGLSSTLKVPTRPRRIMASVIYSFSSSPNLKITDISGKHACSNLAFHEDASINNTFSSKINGTKDEADTVVRALLLVFCSYVYRMAPPPLVCRPTLSETLQLLRKAHYLIPQTVLVIGETSKIENWKIVLFLLLEESSDWILPYICRGVLKERFGRDSRVSN